MKKAIEIAEYFVWLAKERGAEPVSNLKVQKLLYYAQGYALGNFSRPLFLERVMAWNFGPVVEEVYEEYKRFGYGPIDLPEEFNAETFDPDERELLESVFEAYGDLSASALVEQTHNEEPWRASKLKSEITTRAMQAFFKRNLFKRM
ncbi:MAG: SocA family protein [Acidobacteria bacterium]|nr:SocA family protein [Acidobacteriota bacterium]